MARLKFEDITYYASSLGMRAIIDRDQIGERHLRVLLGSGQSGVAQQFLNRAQIGAVGQQVCCISVPETVRVYGGVSCQERSVELHDDLRAAPGQPPAAMVEE